MKRAFGLLFLLIITLSACNHNEDGFTIKVDAKGVADSTLVYLKQQDSMQKVVNLDTAVVINGQFVLHVYPKQTKLGFIIADGINGGLPILVEPKGTVNVTFYKDSVYKSKFGGTKTSDEFYEVYNHMNIVGDSIRLISMELRTLSQKNDTIGLQKAVEKRNKLRTNNLDYELNFAKTHKNSVVSIAMLEKNLASSPDKGDEIATLFDGINDEAKKEYAGTKELQEKLDMLKKTKLGAIIPDFSGKTTEGDTLALSAVKGKVTLIDFWASWCIPCRKENPNVLKIYNAYHDAGFNIMGVSLDKSEDAWKNAILEDKLPWSHILSEETARDFNINMIPTTFLINAAGKIISKNERGAELEAAIAKGLGVANKNVLAGTEEDETM